MDHCLRPMLLSRQVTCLRPFTASSLSICNDQIPLCRVSSLASLRTRHLRQRRNAHTKRNVSSTASNVVENNPVPLEIPRSRPLSCLPLSTIIRSYLITSISSMPFLLRPSLAAMSFLAHTKSPLFNPDRNPVLHCLLKKTFYVQFCAGETPSETRTTIADLKEIGYTGVILGHAKEAVLTDEEAAGLNASLDSPEQAALNEEEIATWRRNTVDTVHLAQKGDFVALKFTGAGRQALQHLKATIPCSREFEDAVHEICKSAQEKGVKLLFDAEQASLQQGIDNWTMYFAKRYNKERALVFGTYQAYAKNTPAALASHLEMARKENFVLGIKLVRGAYLGSDPRNLFWPTIEGTHECYNGIAKAVMQRRYEGILQPIDGAATDFPRVSLVLATHNAESVRLADRLRDEQARKGEPRIELAYGQLMGMADNVSCEVVQTARARSESNDTNAEIPQAYKYLVWGKLGECMKYLLRRAHENKDAVTRTVEARQALGRELGSRMAFWR
ncbi:proline oxidase PrnD [Exophiala viscosa]|uniref:Proline dehydrogenase n=1 Tax=Exophiala viscosa TaxID=2486360 RepID=A0AAN6DP51_9EURO|nr:proline oxidase PrnD [Exophiala viscosa]